MKLPIYFDYAATTPVDPRVAEKMQQYLTIEGHFGNSTSTDPFGLAAKQAIENARAQVANVISADPEEIIWTSGATEANNLALKGITTLYQTKGKHIITLKTEHPSIIDCCQYLEKQGTTVTYLSPLSNGLLDLDQLRAAIRNDTILISIMHVNNEIGVIQDLPAIAELTASRGILLHVDAAQSGGKIPLDVKKIPVDLISFCAHKNYGPKGIGALYLRKKPRVRVAAQIHGGGQEYGMRSGTLPTHQIVGMGEAFFIAYRDREVEQQKLRELRECFLQGIQPLKNITVHGDMTHHFPGILNFSVSGVKAQTLMKALPDLSLSTGSACHSKGIEPSYVLRALGLSAAKAQEAVRFSFGRFTTLAEIDYAVQLLSSIRV